VGKALTAPVVAGLAAQVLNAFSVRVRTTGGTRQLVSGALLHQLSERVSHAQASFVTPIILDNREQHPWIWVLEALPCMTQSLA